MARDVPKWSCRPVGSPGARARRSLLEEGDVLAALTPTGDAGGLQLLVVLHRGVELLLGPFEVALLLLQGVLLVCLLLGLVLDVLGHYGRVHLRVLHELGVLVRGGRL